MNIKGAIFDMDGTLLDSMTVWDTLAEDYLRTMGIEPRENLSERFKTMSIEQSADYYISRYGLDKTHDEIINDINCMIEDFYISEAPLKDGVKEFLDYLRGKGTVMCVATTIDKNIASKALERCGISGYFVHIVTCGEAEAGKDEPAIYEKALEYLGTEKKYTFVFEDALHAAVTAKNAGFPVAGVYDASEDAQNELQVCSNVYIKDFRAGKKYFL